MEIIMKNIEKKKYKIIYDVTAAGFEKKINAALEDLEDYHPEITIDGKRQKGFLAYIVLQPAGVFPRQAAAAEIRDQFLLHQ